MALAQAQAPAPLKIGITEGFSGVYADLNLGEVEAAQMAIDDFGGKVLGRPIELLSADHQTKPDIGAQIARRWYDVDGVKMITGIGTSSVALAVRKIAQEKGMIDINTGAASADLTGPACSETGAHWVYDTYALAKVTGGAIVKGGGDSWYFLTADYAFGHALERDVTAVVTASGGKVLGGVRHPLSTQDFSSFLLQAQASKAKIIGLANAGQDTINSIKQAGEFGIVKGGQRLAGLLVFSTDVNSLTLPVAQGLVLTEAFYWDMNDETRAWTKRFRAKRDKIPSMLTAGAYSSVNALPQGRAGRRHRRRQGGDGQDARDPGQRRHDQERQAARGRPPDPRHVPVPGEVAGGVQEQGRHLQAAGHRAGRRGLSSAQGRQVPVHQVIDLGHLTTGKGACGRPFSFVPAEGPSYNKVMAGVPASFGIAVRGAAMCHPTSCNPRRDCGVVA